MKGYEERRPRTIAIKNLKVGDKFYQWGDEHTILYIRAAGEGDSAAREGEVEIGYSYFLHRKNPLDFSEPRQKVESWSIFKANGRVNREPYYGAAGE